MSALDTIAAIGVGTYLISVAFQGNGEKLIDTLQEDKAFVKWALAVGIALYAYKIPEARGIVTLIITAAFIGLFLQQGTKISENASAIWNSLGDSMK